jgi:hypothetical protein
VRSEMEDDPCTPHWQDEMAIRRTLSQSRRIYRWVAVRQFSPVQQRLRQAQLGQVRRAAQGAASRGATHAVHGSSNALLARRLYGHTGATPRIGAQPSVVERYCCCFEISETRGEIRRAKTSNIRFATEDLQHSTGEGAIPACVKDGSLNVSHRRRRGLWYPVR